MGFYGGAVGQGGLRLGDLVPMARSESGGSSSFYYFPHLLLAIFHRNFTSIFSAFTNTTPFLPQLLHTTALALLATTLAYLPLITSPQLLLTPASANV